MICCVCGNPATASRMYEDMCQFHWDCLQHELRIILDAIRDFGPYGRETGPQFGVTFYGYLQGGPYTKPGFSTLGYGLYVSMSPKEAMMEAQRVAWRNDWKLLRLDVQAGASRRLGMQTCTNIYVSPEFQTYMKYSDLGPLPYDSSKYGALQS